MRNIVASILLLGSSSVCWGTTFFTSCHLCDPGSSTDSQVIAILNRYASIAGPLDRVSIAQDTPSNSQGQYYYVDWSYKKVIVNGQSAKSWLPVSDGYAATAFNATGGSSGGGAGGGGGGYGGIVMLTTGSSWGFTCTVGGSPVDCDTGDPI